jgi:hypothetical protein
VAETDAQRRALERRYRSALSVAAKRGTLEAVTAFEDAAGQSKAVMARPFPDLHRITSSDQQLFTTYYKLLDAEVQLPPGDKWDQLRRMADEALFPGYRDHIRFAALSLDGRGLPHYGEVFFVLREDMIAHRASVYEENTAVSLKKQRYEPRPGLRAIWNDRAKLCVAKTAAEIEAGTPAGEFPDLLLRQGATPDEDRFVEVHIWGPMTIRTVQKIGISPTFRRHAFRKEIRDRAKRHGIEVVEWR